MKLQDTKDKKKTPCSKPYKASGKKINKAKGELNHIINKRNREHLLFKWPQNKLQNFQKTKTEQKTFFNDNVEVNVKNLKTKSPYSLENFKQSFKQMWSQREKIQTDNTEQETRVIRKIWLWALRAIQQKQHRMKMHMPYIVSLAEKVKISKGNSIINKLEKQINWRIG